MNNLTQKQVFQAVFAALIAAIFVCFLVYYNFKMLGEFFFVTVTAAITSLWLRKVKSKIEKTVLAAIGNQFHFVKSTFWYKVFSKFIIPTIKKRNPCQLFYQLKYEYQAYNSRREKEKLTIFNNTMDVAMILLVYVCLTKFGIRVTLLVFINLSLLSLFTMFILDVSILIMHSFGIIKSSVLDPKTGKLQQS